MVSNAAYQLGNSNESLDKPLVFVLEDDPDLQAILSFNLQKEGFRVRCYARAEDALQVLEATPDVPPACVIVDINLAGQMNGIEATNYIRSKKETSRIPVLMLTAKAENHDIVRGLDIGADDYLPKPFDMGVLHARVKAVVRRIERNSAAIPESKEKLSLAGIEIDPVSHVVMVEGKDVGLTLTEFGILKSLMARHGEVLTRDDLILRIMGPAKTVTGRTIDVHIRALREKLGAKADHVTTVRGVGYKFVV